MTPEEYRIRIAPEFPDPADQDAIVELFRQNQNFQAVAPVLSAVFARQTRSAVVRPTRDELAQCLRDEMSWLFRDEYEPAISEIIETLVERGWLAVSDSQETPTP